MLRRTTDEQVDVVRLDGQVDNLQPFFIGYFVEDVSHTGCNVTDEYRFAVLRYPHYVVVEVVRCVPCGLRPYYTLCLCGILKLSYTVGNPAVLSSVEMHAIVRLTRA